MTSSPSVVRRLLWALIGSLSMVAIVLGAGGALLIHGIAESTSDRILAASARAIAETLAVEDDEITLDIPPFALGMLENNERDNIYYSVRHDARLITGYPDLPLIAPPQQALETPYFAYVDYRSARVRIAGEARRLPRIPGPIIVEVAETLDAREELANRMLRSLVILEAALVGVAALLVWPAAMWSLSPVTRLRETMDAREADFAPLPMEAVPSELTGLVTGFNALLRRLESSVEGMRRFTADASHQMRTPLAILRTHLSLVGKHGLESPVGKSSYEDVLHATDRLQALLTGLIALARAEETAAPVGAQLIDLRTVVGQVVFDLSSQADSAGVALTVKLPRRAVRLETDAVLLAELTFNLVDNAVRYNQAGGKVLVTLRATPAGPRIEVIDDGPGIPPEKRELALSRFYRLPRDQQQAGSGLGLPIVAAICRRLGASVTLGDGPRGRGITACVQFPPRSRNA